MKSGPQIGCGLEDQVPTQWGTAATSSATTNGPIVKPIVSAATIRRTRFGSDGLHFACRPTVRVSAGTGVNANLRRAFEKKQGATVFFIGGEFGEISPKLEECSIDCNLLTCSFGARPYFMASFMRRVAPEWTGLQEAISQPVTIPERP